MSANPRFNPSVAHELPSTHTMMASVIRKFALEVISIHMGRRTDRNIFPVKLTVGKDVQ